MPLAKCRRCGGDGHHNDQNPTKPGVYDWCQGCSSDGEVNVIDPQNLCKRCGGDGHHNDQNPTKPGVYDWCAGCAGTGYAR